MLKSLSTKIEISKAHNSELYKFLDESASIEQIVNFLRWDAHQPAFIVFLSQWLDKTPEQIKPALQEHIDEEQGHSEMFCEMLNYLEEKVSIAPTQFNESVLEKLNYSFSKQCSTEKSIAFFLGTFWATEIMSEKRCRQIYNGLIRLGHDISRLEYLRLHFEVDAQHGDDVKTKMILPLYNAGIISFEELDAGIEDRLTRSSEFTEWYFSNQLFENDRATQS